MYHRKPLHAVQWQTVVKHFVKPVNDPIHVPRRLVIDNLKAAIVRAVWHDPVVQRSYREFAERVRSGVAPEQTPESRMWAGVLAFVDAVEEHPEWWVLE